MRSDPAEPVIELVLVDDHPAVLAGLVGLVDAEPGLLCRAAVSSAAVAHDAARRSGADVVVADYELPDSDGLALCAELKALPTPPGVVLYSAFARPSMVPAAAVAGADALVDKADPPAALFDAVRAVARGTARLPSASPDAVERCFEKLEPEDIPLFGMALNGTPPSEIAAVLGLDEDGARRRLRVVLGRLQGGPSEFSARTRA